MIESPLDQPPQQDTLDTLRRGRIISPDAYWEAIRQLTPSSQWARVASHFFILLGATLLLASVVFFFAYNWEAFSPWQKLGSLQTGLILSLIVGQYLGFSRLGGQLFLMAASILTGVCFAVYGQVYQTGADAFGFFGAWALAIFLWVVVARFSPLWVLFFVLLNLTSYFFWDQVGRFREHYHYVYLCFALTAINGAGLLLLEKFSPTRSWLKAFWLRPLFLLTTIVPLSIPAYDTVFDYPWDDIHLPAATVCWLLILAGSYVFYRRKHFDPTCLTIILADAALMLIMIAIRILPQQIAEGLYFIIIAMVVLAMGAFVAWEVRRLTRLAHSPIAGKDSHERP